jgi:hypothetical protein
VYNYIFPYLKKYNIFSITRDSLETMTKDEPKTEVVLFDISNNTVLKKEYDKMEYNKIEFLNQVVIIISEPPNINKKILYDLEICNNQFETSDITFIALYLNYNHVRYHINLKTDKYNYYLVGNVINKLFLQYYINLILNNVNFVIDDEKVYSLELMDHEVNMIYLDITQSIIIDKTGYHVNDQKEKVVNEVINEVINEVVNEVVNEALDN